MKKHILILIAALCMTACQATVQKKEENIASIDRYFVNSRLSDASNKRQPTVLDKKWTPDDSNLTNNAQASHNLQANLKPSPLHRISKTFKIVPPLSDIAFNEKILGTAYSLNASPVNELLKSIKFVAESADVQIDKANGFLKVYARDSELVKISELVKSYNEINGKKIRFDIRLISVDDKHAGRIGLDFEQTPASNKFNYQSKDTATHSLLTDYFYHSSRFQNTQDMLAALSRDKNVEHLGTKEKLIYNNRVLDFQINKVHVRMLPHIHQDKISTPIYFEDNSSVKLKIVSTNNGKMLSTLDIKDNQTLAINLISSDSKKSYLLITPTIL